MRILMIKYWNYIKRDRLEMLVNTGDWGNINNSNFPLFHVCQFKRFLFVLADICF